MKPKKPTLEDQLAFIATQHEVYPTELFQSLVEAKEKGKPIGVADLNVEYRGNVASQSIFLITRDSKVVAQFRVPDETLARTDVSFDNSMDSSKIRREIARQNPAPSHLKIENLRVGMKKINVSAEVLQVSEPSKVHTQFRDNAIVSNAVVGDETGKVLLCLWDQQIGSVHVGDCIEIKNAHVAMFKGEKQLRLGKNGKICLVQKTLENQLA
jgi:replication factor A1